MNNTTNTITSISRRRALGFLSTTKHGQISSHSPSTPLSSHLQLTTLLPTNTFSTKASSSSNTTTTKSTTFPSHRQTILQSTLPHVHSYGWTQDAIAQGALSSNLPLSLTGLVTPKDLISHFMMDCNSKLRWYMRELTKSSSSSSSSSGKESTDVVCEKKARLEQGIRYRLELVIPYVESHTWHEGMAIGAWENTLGTSKELDELVSILFQESFEGTTTPGPMERMALGGVYVSTELHLLADQSEGYRDTWIFLSERMNDYQSLFLNSNDGSSIPMKMPGLPDSNMIVGASAVAASLGSAVLSLALPNVGSGVKGMIDGIASRGMNVFSNSSAFSGMGVVPPDLSSFQEGMKGVVRMNDSSSSSVDGKEKEILKDLPDFDQDVGLGTGTKL